MPPPSPNSQPGRIRGVWVPRWVLQVAGALALAFLAQRILHEPAWTVQRLESPDGRRTALLQRTTYVKDHFRIRVKDGRLWFVPYYSPAFTNNFREDLGERLRWSEDSEQLYFRLHGQDVWTYDFREGKGRNLIPPGTNQQDR